MNSSNRRPFEGKKWGKRPYSNFKKYENRSSHDKGKRNILLVQNRLLEDEVGITEYTSTVQGFSGVIKARYSDFHVNEINLNGDVAKLTDIRVPKDFRSETEANEELDTPKERLEQIPEEIWSNMLTMLQSTESQVVKLDVTAMSKEERGKVHEGVKKVFGHKIVGSTKMDGDKKNIEFKKSSKSDRSDNRYKWPAGIGEYVHFIVYKEAIDTIEVAFKISDCLKMRSAAFTYAGVKDKRAKSTQWFCVKKVDPFKLLHKTKCLRNVHVGNIMFQHQPLKLGQLKGNRFRIALRNVVASEELISSAIESVKINGFINYFGLQRFGNDKAVPTYDIGIKLMQGNWKEACDLILKIKQSDDPDSDVSKAKKVFHETSDSSKACAEFHRNKNKCIEYLLLHGFSKSHSNDYVNALENIPRNMRLLYIHSFQSFLWNRMVSRRIKEYGLKPIVGDLVLNTENNKGCVEASLSEEVDLDPEASTSNVIYAQAKALTEDDLPNYSIYDVVLPLPGYDVLYPENEVKEWYRSALETHGLSLEMPKQKVKTYTLSGSYRSILGRAKNLTWKTMKYNNPVDTLIRSDYEELSGHSAPQDVPNGQYRALLLDMCLDSCSYATMMLREILKTDTSVTAHAKLNDYHEATESSHNGPKASSAQYAHTESLLSNADKYEEFKKRIFEVSEEDKQKRKLEENNESSENKKLKTAENTEVTTEKSLFKLEASLA